MPRRRTRVDLAHRDDRLTGLIFGVSVDVPLDIPISESATSGTYGDVRLAARWKIASNYNTSEQPASLVATFGDESVELTTTFMLLDDQNPTLVGATIVGSVGGEPVDLQVAPGHDPHDDVVIQRIIGVESDPADPNVVYERGILIGPVSRPSSRWHDELDEYVLDGRVGASRIAVIARASREKSSVEGTIDGAAVKLTATRSNAQEDGIRIKGRWHGEPSLCLLSTACMLYFM